MSKTDAMPCRALAPSASMARALPSRFKLVGKAMASPPEARSAPESKGLLRRLFGSIFEPSEPPEKPPSTPIDLSAYRRRAQELLEHLQQANQDVAARLVELGVVAGKLEALIEDLKSIHAEAKELRPLETLLEELRALLAEGRPEDAEVAALWAKAEAVLRAFSGSPVGQRESFWK